MKELYEKLEINIQTIADEDIITTSAPGPEPRDIHENAYVDLDVFE